ncbi:MAG: T9SS type A sorting domain-containing protein [Ignavibacteriales bacterium]|nr:T9SS type A sorting domain-containing protein [Ignavibacteriales bacterium]
MKNRIIYIAALVLLIAINISAMDFRVNQIPNGGKFGCANCHVSPAGGGARNAFGQMVESKYLDFNGNVKWSAAMAAEDPDGDGFTNGQELQDPTGAWGAGDKAPGTASLVTNPGDRNSKPAGTDVEGIELPTTYSLAQNYPNPFNPTTKINFTLPVSGKVVLEIFDITGKSVATLVDAEMQSGIHSVEFNAVGLSSGIYLYRIKANQFIATRKFVLMK